MESKSNTGYVHVKLHSRGKDHVLHLIATLLDNLYFSPEGLARNGGPEMIIETAYFQIDPLKSQHSSCDE
jgi:hypothetical protein